MNRTLERLLRRLWRDPLTLGAVFFLTALVLVAILAPHLGLQDPQVMNVGQEVQLPSPQHWLGTDSFGRDNLSQLIYGARVSLEVAVGSVAGALIVGTGIGVVSGYYRGAVDSVLMRLMDTVLSFPPILLAIALLGVLGPGTRNVIIGLGVVYMPVFARIARAKTVAETSREYVLAAKALGAGDRRIIVRHVVPNILSPVIVQSAVSAAFAIVAEAGMSFLGLGTQPPTPSWGIMLSAARDYMNDRPWFSLVPGVMLALTVLSITFVGDSLREVLDVRSS